MSQLYANNASALLISDLLVADATITLAPGEGDQFPLPDAGDDTSFSMMTLEDVGGNIEIVKMTERSGDILTIERAQEDTAPAGFAIGSRVECRLTAGSLANFKQVADQYELRGDLIDSDGIRLWHQQDPSTYQFFTLRYYTLDVLGVPIMQIESPPGIDGLSVFFTVTGPDGTLKHATFNPDFSNTAPVPATGQVAFTAPGVVAWNTINGGLVNPTMYGSWENDVPSNTFKLQFAANKTNPVSFEFRPRDEFEAEHPVLINKDGSITARSLYQLQSSYDGTYSEAKPVDISYGLSTTRPGDTDVVRFIRSNYSTALRQMEYHFITNYVTSTDPVVYSSRIVKLNAEGTISVPVGPTDDSHLTNKQYVDNIALGTSTGEGLNIMAEKLYGRTVLFNNAGGANNDGTIYTLDSGLAFSDFYSVEVTFISSNGMYSMTLDTQTLADKGYTEGWTVIPSDGTGQDNRIAWWNPRSDTTFDTGEASLNSGKCVRIIGRFPKNAGGV